MKKVTVICALMAGVLATSHASFILLDDFESYTAGNSIFTENATDYSIGGGIGDATVESASGNQYLSQGTLGTANAHTIFNNGNTLLADESVGTYFFRMSTPVAGSHHGTSVSYLDSYNNGWNDGTAILRVSDGVNLGSKLYGFDESIGTSGNYATLANNTTASTWYNVWIVLNNTSGNRSYDVHIQSDDDANYLTQTQIGNDLEFRVNQSDPNTPGSMESLFFRSANDGSAANFDDLYFDGAGENLINPIPEPGTLGLIAVFGGAVLFIRRHFTT